MHAKQAFVPKNRKPKFELTLKIIDLNNVPLICGTSYVKWHLPSSSSAEHRGHTSKALIHDHKAIYDYHKVLPVRMTIDKHQVLQDCEVHFEVLQEYSEAGRGGRVLLGNVKVNLAEYVDDGDDRGRERDGTEGDDERGIVRRYLMRESKINSTLKIGIKLRQLEGDSSFTAPALKTATVFGGIAGVMSADVGDGADETRGHMPSITNKTRELSELQDMYRRTLAASWSCTPYELPPDKLIEDLFAGGDGGSMKPPPSILKPRSSTPSQQGSPRADDDAGGESANASETESRRTVRNGFLSPDAAARTGPQSAKGDFWSNSSSNSGWRSPASKSMNRIHASTPSASPSAVSGRQSIEQQMHRMGKDTRRKGQRSAREVSEFDLREDLRSWEVGARRG